MYINPFSTNVPLPYLLKTSENRRFYVFRGYRSGTSVENGLIVVLWTLGSLWQNYVNIKKNWAEFLCTTCKALLFLKNSGLLAATLPQKNNPLKKSPYVFFQNTSK